MEPENFGPTRSPFLPGLHAYTVPAPIRWFPSLLAFLVIDLWLRLMALVPFEDLSGVPKRSLLLVVQRLTKGEVIDHPEVR